jgi:hypothetical protein
MHREMALVAPTKPRFTIAYILLTSDLKLTRDERRCYNVG